MDNLDVGQKILGKVRLHCDGEVFVSYELAKQYADEIAKQGLNPVVLSYCDGGLGRYLSHPFSRVDVMGYVVLETHTARLN
jgi:hypothetical protein